MELPKGLADEVVRLVRSALQEGTQPRRPAEDRKYRYSQGNNELGYRLVLGEDPARVPQQEREAVDVPSPRTLRGLINGDDDCPLYSIKVGGRAYVPEVAVRQYERYLHDGAPAYMDVTA